MSYGGNRPSADSDPDQDQQAGQAGDQFERQDLIDMVHEKRGITPGLEPEQMTPKRPTRITHHEIKAMKVTVQKESSPHVGLFRKIGGLFSGIITSVSGFFSASGRRASQCELNGHVLPKDWKGDFPRCKHCGTVIKNPEEIHPGRK